MVITILANAVSRFRLLIVFSISLLFIGCGYHLRKTGEPTGIEMKSLAIPLMASTSSSLGFEGDFTRFIREQFISHSKVPLVSKDKAEFVLIGKIVQINTEPLSYSSIRKEIHGETITYDETKQRRIQIIVSLKLVERATGNIIWENRSMEGKSSFSLGTDQLQTRYNQRMAVRNIAKTLSEKIYLKSVERF
jgi:hypothetical protein